MMMMMMMMMIIKVKFITTGMVWQVSSNKWKAS